ncbi:MAG: selenocysteine-specific translation elongation factor, partial [Anaerolineales bacterium]|nr:selenocysteine-specific translation elongation factor [Anaerolineales bacterium]
IVEAITGTHPDRLKEEREREMTIELGFAWLTLPNGEDVGIVDVPGHRDFIENMLAGVGSIDAALFVIAADEGVMPQTREHLAILDLLEIQGGIVALTKIDLMTDDEWLGLVEDEIREVLDGTVLASAPMVRVSATNGEGIPELIDALSECLAEKPPRPDLGRPRLPVDRVFTIAGFGTVVTGTLNDGQLRIGDEVEVLPKGQRGRVRGLQTHKRSEDVAVPGSRTAVNISGVNVDQVQRGNVIAHPNDFQPTGRIDVQFRLLAEAGHTIKHNTEVKLFIGANEVLARLRLLGTEELVPGETGWLQLESKEKIITVRGDRYILRRPSPGETIGGGVVVDPHPKGRHKRFSTEILTRLDALVEGTPGDILFQALLSQGAAPLKDVIVQSQLDNTVVTSGLDELLSSGKLVSLESSDTDLAARGIKTTELVTSKPYWEQLSSSVIRELDTYHHDYPLRMGMPREELKSRLNISQRLFNVSMNKLVQQGVLQESGPLVFRPDHTIRYTPQQKLAIENLLAKFKISPYSPPSVKECKVMVGEDVFNAMVDQGQLVMLSADVVFSREGYEDMVSEVKRLLSKHETLKAAEVRDHFNTSRKYALALLEHMDAVGITVREGDLRRLKK